MTDRELMQQALFALESVFEGDDKGAEYWTVTGGTYEAVECMNAMRALRARLAQPEREWQGLTDEEIKQLWKDTPQLVGVYSYTDIAREVEAKLKEKNA